MIDYLIIFEVFQRELENILLIKLELEKRGYSVAIERRPFRAISILRKKYLNKVKCVLVPTVYSEDVIYSVYLIAGKVEKICNLQWEQVSSFAGESGRTGGRSIYPQGICKGAIQLCWGEKPVENLILSGMEKNRCTIVGPVQMDFLRPEFKQYYKNRSEICSEYSFDSNKQILTFISSFSLTAAPSDLKKYLSDVVGKNYIEDFAEISICSQNKILDWFDRYLEEFPKTELIYRPHPTEFNSERLKEINEKHPNFHIISDYSVKQWILISDKILMWYSTSCAEAYFANKPFCILRPYTIPHDRELTIMEGAKFTTCYNDMVCELDQGNSILSPLNHALIDLYYNYDSSVPAYVRLADAITLNYSALPKMQWNHISFKSFRKRALHEIPKQELMPIYIKTLLMVDRLNKKHGFNILSNRILRYKKLKESTNAIFDRDAETWEKLTPSIIATLQKIVYGTK